MNMLINFIDTGFIITLGILILVTGAVMLYCYRRLNLLENSVIEHGKILQNFIINYNNNQVNNQINNQMNNQMNNIGIPNFSLTQENNLDNQNNEIIETSNIYNEELNIGKIAVSDDEHEDKNDYDEVEVEDEDEDEDNHDNEDEDDDDSDDDDNDSDDDDSDDDDNDNDNDNDNDDNDEKANTIKKLDITSFEIEDNGLQIESIDTKINTLEDDFLNNVPINLENLNIASISIESKLINLGNDEERTDIDNDENNDNESVSIVGELKKGFSKMKVDDLRTLVVTKNLTDNDNSQKMKKNDLIKMLQSN